MSGIAFLSISDDCRSYDEMVYHHDADSPPNVPSPSTSTAWRPPPAPEGHKTPAADFSYNEADQTEGFVVNIVRLGLMFVCLTAGSVAAEPSPAGYYLADLAPGLAKKTSSTTTRLSPNSVRVAQRWNDFAAVHTFSVGGLHFRFTAPPVGRLTNWHASFLTASRLSVFHPSLLNKIGGFWAADGVFGVGVSPNDPDPGRHLAMVGVAHFQIPTTAAFLRGERAGFLRAAGTGSRT
ncbi:MAG: hypothetical protein ACRC1K_07080 [Planctomycetia bacterium]